MINFKDLNVSNPFGRVIEYTDGTQEHVTITRDFDVPDGATPINRNTANLLQADIRKKTVSVGKTVTVGDVVDLDSDGNVYTEKQTDPVPMRSTETNKFYIRLEDGTYIGHNSGQIVRYKVVDFGLEPIGAVSVSGTVQQVRQSTSNVILVLTTIQGSNSNYATAYMYAINISDASLSIAASATVSSSYQGSSYHSYGCIASNNLFFCIQQLNPNSPPGWNLCSYRYQNNSITQEAVFSTSGTGATLYSSESVTGIYALTSENILFINNSNVFAFVYRNKTFSVANNISHSMSTNIPVKYQTNDRLLVTRTSANSSYMLLGLSGDNVVLLASGNSGYTITNGYSTGYYLLAMQNSTTLVMLEAQSAGLSLENTFSGQYSVVNVASTTMDGENGLWAGGNYVFEIISGDLKQPISYTTKTAIAMESGSSGDEINIVYHGFVNIAGISDGQEILSDGVKAKAPADNWLCVVGTYFMGTVIRTGTYVGTGVSGSGNPNTLTFDFVPNLLVIKKYENAGNDFPVTFINPSPEGIYGRSSSSNVYGANIISWGKTCSWYCESHQNSDYNTAQQNLSGTTYVYLAAN